LRAFVDAWNALNYVTIYSLMSEDIFYHNLPLKPVIGRKAVRAYLDAYPIDKCEWELLNVAVNGGTVLTERVDRFVRGKDQIVIPVMGAFEVKDGLITQWRDYFDLGALKPRQQP
jgi:limonene-1,2-epoxide hydrolase